MAGRDAHLLHDGVLEGEMVPAVDQQLVLEMLGRVEVFARGLLTIAATLWKGESWRRKGGGLLVTCC